MTFIKEILSVPLQRYNVLSLEKFQDTNHAIRENLLLFSFLLLHSPSNNVETLSTSLSVERCHST